MVQRLVIMACRPGGIWGTRNDRFAIEDGSSGSYEAKLERRRQQVVREVQNWQAVEPATEFRVEEVGW